MRGDLVSRIQRDTFPTLPVPGRTRRGHGKTASTNPSRRQHDNGQQALFSRAAPDRPTERLAPKCLGLLTIVSAVIHGYSGGK